jgi:NAD(P)-dependent dehydrogenase (short-subunit alcohol dehydrogenase family)
MRDLRSRVAVVTGAASGIGLATAHRFADEGMHLVLADIERGALAAVEAAIKATGTTVLAVVTDVASQEAVSGLADAAFSTFGNVHVVFNNAGVAATKGVTVRMRAWEGTLADWDWTLGVNLMGVLHGVRAFVPRMLDSGEQGHVVNTASIAGLTPGADPYHVSKHGVVCLTEGLYRDLRAMGASVSASVLCPGLVQTKILDAERNRRDGAKTDVESLRPELRQFAVDFDAALRAGYSPEVVAAEVVNGIREDRFYLLPAQPELLAAVDVRARSILERRNPDPA